MRVRKRNTACAKGKPGISSSCEKSWKGIPSAGEQRQQDHALENFAGVGEALSILSVLAMGVVLFMLGGAEGGAVLTILKGIKTRICSFAWCIRTSWNWREGGDADGLGT
jgi:hypothetical protein